MEVKIKKHKNGLYHVFFNGYRSEEPMTKAMAEQHKKRMTQAVKDHTKLLKGGDLSVDNLHGLLDASYTGVDKVNDFDKDNELSTKTSKVYRDPNTNQVVVAHRGTSGLADWKNNLIYGVLGTKAYKKTDRYKEAERVQRAAEAKYGASNISTVGHSAGGAQAELLGQDSKEIITLNKAAVPFQNREKRPDNQYDIRTKNDLVSKLTEIRNRNKNAILIHSKSHNLLKEHTIDTVKRLNKDRRIGKR